MHKLIQIYPNIYCLASDNKRTLGLTFCRFAEHYESPFFKGKTFTLKEYKNWYLTKFDVSKFDYCTEYVGFNLPDHVFKPFVDGKFNPLTKNEKNLLNQVKDLPKPFYLIGVNRGHNDCMVHLYHEVAHGLYYLNPAYRKAMNKLVKLIPNKILKDIYESFENVGYHPDVYTDELQAYLIDETPPYDFYDIDPITINKFVKEFEKYCDYKKLANQFYSDILN